MRTEIPERPKDPDTDTWFGMDWGLDSKFLGSDTIATSTWILEAGLIKIAEDNTTKMGRVKVRGGIIGGGTIKEDNNSGNYSYRATNEITTTISEEKLHRSVDIVIQHL